MSSPSARQSHCGFCAIRLYSLPGEGFHFFAPAQLSPSQMNGFYLLCLWGFLLHNTRHCLPSAGGDAVHWIRAGSACFRRSSKNETFSFSFRLLAVARLCGFFWQYACTSSGRGSAAEASLALSPTGTHGFPPDFSAFHERPAGTESSRRGAMRVTACESSAPAPYPRRYSPFPSADRGCGRFPSSSFLFSPARGLPPARPLQRCFLLPSA